MTDDPATLWTIIIGLGVGTFLLRFSFLGIIGGRMLPAWVLRLLRYTPMAVIPALVAPAVMWPAATGGETDPARLAAALATIVAGIWFRNVLMAILAGGIALYALPFILG